MTRVARWFVRLVVLLMMAASMAVVAQPVGASAQAASPQTAGSASVGFSDEWVYDPASSDVETAFLTHEALLGTIFIYGEITDPTILDAETGIEEFAEGFFGAFGDGDHTVVESGVIMTDTTWRLYSLSLDTVPFGAFVSANSTAIPGDVIITVLVSPAGSFGEAVDSVHVGISINGGLTTVDAFETQELVTALEGGGTDAPPQALTTPDAAPDLTLPPLGGASPEPTQPGLTLPPLGGATLEPTQPDPVQLTENVVVSGAQIAYGGEWTFSEAASTPDQIAFFLSDISPATFFGYAIAPNVPGDVATSLSEFAGGFFGEFGAVNVVEVTTEALPSGNGFSVYTGDQAGIPLVILVHADVTTDPSQFRAQVLITPLADFDASFTSVQQSFEVDGVGSMSELDGALLSELLGTGGLAPDTMSTPPTPVADAGTTSGPSDGIADYQALDTQGACDAIGWVVTSPEQLPATEADIDFRAACTGGAAFVANCGTSAGNAIEAPEAGMTWIRCDVTVRVDSVPMELSMLDYMLLAGVGSTYPVDIIAAVALDDSVMFPVDDVQVGQTAQGSVVFSVPQDAPGPWVVEVSPIATGGQEPGTLVIDGELQPFDVFGS